MTSVSSLVEVGEPSMLSAIDLKHGSYFTGQAFEHEGQDSGEREKEGSYSSTETLGDEDDAPWLSKHETSVGKEVQMVPLNTVINEA